MTGCGMIRVVFMEEVWRVVQCYGSTHSLMKTGLNRPLLQEIRENLDDCEGLSELLNDSATDENETTSPIKVTRQESITNWFIRTCCKKRENAKRKVAKRGKAFTNWFILPGCKKGECKQNWTENLLEECLGK